jgi:hypothetical protein
MTRREAKAGVGPAPLGNEGTTRDHRDRNLPTKLKPQRDSTLRQGCVLLDGDAAHVDNRIGDMGLNGELQDAAHLVGKLRGVIANGESDRALDLQNLQAGLSLSSSCKGRLIANERQLEKHHHEVPLKNLLRDGTAMILDETVR